MLNYFSSLSTGLNSTAAVVLEDCCKSFLKKELSEKETHTLMKLSVLVMGIICVCLVFVVEKLGTVLQVRNKIYHDKKSKDFYLIYNASLQ